MVNSGMWIHSMCFNCRRHEGRSLYHLRIPAFQAEAPVVFQGVLEYPRIRVPLARSGTPEGTDRPEAWVLVV